LSFREGQIIDKIFCLDGVSEGQFPHVIERELPAIKGIPFGSSPELPQCSPQSQPHLLSLT